MLKNQLHFYTDIVKSFKMIIQYSENICFLENWHNSFSFFPSAFLPYSPVLSVIPAKYVSPFFSQNTKEIID